MQDKAKVLYIRESVIISSLYVKMKLECMSSVVHKALSNFGDVNTHSGAQILIYSFIYALFIRSW